ncbi:MAG: 7-cyano-7-deazaguanine synthase QueC [Janthinobacterium lividum]
MVLFPDRPVREQRWLTMATISSGSPVSASHREKVVVCLSGGMDSTVCAALAARDYDAYALHFSYGQRTEARELKSATAVSQMLGFKQFLPLRMDLFRQIGGSALTDASIAVPDAKPETAANSSERTGSEVPVTYVPFRNAHFLAAAVSWAEVLGAQTVFIGAVEQDSSGYPDCRPAYYDAFNALVRQGTKDGDIRVETPLISMRKRDIVALGIELRAPLHVSWSCYSGEDFACGVCESCVLRLRAFQEAGAVDPIPYRSTEIGSGTGATLPHQ